MSNVMTWNVARHLLAQVGAIGLMGALVAISHADFSSLGVYGPLVSAFVATLVSIANEVIGSAPKTGA
jgi:hypothetical protein